MNSLKVQHSDTAMSVLAYIAVAKQFLVSLFLFILESLHGICLCEEVSVPHLALFPEISHSPKIILGYFIALNLC